MGLKGREVRNVWIGELMRMPDDTCQCKRHKGHPCAARPTQEDLLCDTCRGPAGPAETAEKPFQLLKGCAVMFVNGEPFAVHQDPVSITFRLPGGMTL